MKYLGDSITEYETNYFMDIMNIPLINIDEAKELQILYKNGSITGNTLIQNFSTDSIKQYELLLNFTQLPRCVINLPKDNEIKDEEIIIDISASETGLFKVKDIEISIIHEKEDILSVNFTLENLTRLIVNTTGYSNGLYLIYLKVFYFNSTNVNVRITGFYINIKEISNLTTTEIIENETSSTPVTFKSPEKIQRFLTSHPNIRGVLIYNDNS